MIDELGSSWVQEEPRRPRRPPPRGRKKKRRTGRSAGFKLMSAVLLLALGVGVYWGVGEIQTNQRLKEMFAADFSQGDMGDEIEFTVHQGDGGTKIANRLLEAGVIESRTAFVQVCESRKRECTAIQPGTYKVKLHSPAETVFNILVDPKNREVQKFTIREGLTVIQTLTQLSQQTGIPLADFQSAASDPAALGITAEWYTRRDGKPNAVEQRKSVEGFLFPDTYQYDASFTARDILKLMVDQFFVVADRVHLKERAAALTISPYEVLITASMVQAEGLEQDFAKIARVAYNRVYKGKVSCHCLQFDSTARYWLEIQAGAPLPPGPLTSAQLNDGANPYNTYDKTPGMPLGPIGNPGEAALNAAANPATGDWLYFVVIKPDGTTAFATTHSQHCANVAEGIRNGVDLDPNC